MNDFLEKYHPKSNLPELLTKELKTETDEDIFGLWKGLVSAVRVSGGYFLIIGRFLKKFRDEKLYEKLDYENFSQFLSSEEIGFSREKAYMYIKTYEYYIEYLQLDPERIGQINVSRLSLMVPVLRQIEDKTEAIKQIEEMSTLRHGDFVQNIKDRTPRGGKPDVYFSVELGKWIVKYHPNVTFLQADGDFIENE